MQAESNGNVRRTEGEWREILARWRKSGTSVLEFCKKEGIALSTFRRWQQRLDGSEGCKEFVALTVAPSVVSSPAWTLEVELPGGAKLRFRG